MATYHDLLQSFIDHDGTAVLRASEIASIKFPLRLTEVMQVDSKISPAVQLADVMVGAALEAANTMVGQRSGGLDPKDLIPLYAEHQIIHMLPDLDFAEQRRFRQGVWGGEIIDYFAANFARTPGSAG